MTNKLLIIILLSALSFASSAQDTVRYPDGSYLYKPLGGNNYIRDIYGATTLRRPFVVLEGFFQKYTQSDRDIVVYGIAMPSHNWPTENAAWMPSLYFLQQVTKDDSLLYTITDSAKVDENRYNRFFAYPYNVNNSERVAVSCSEFYFDTPHSISANDTFLIDFWWPTEKHNIFSDSIFTIYGSDTFFYMYLGITSMFQEEWYFPLRRDSIRNEYVLITESEVKCTWGGIFPIIGLRCAKPYLWVEERGSTEARVRWTQAEAGIEYEVAWGRYGVEPDSCPSVLLTDTTFALSNLEPGSRNAVWVRKACHYATPGYDTVVWSDWSRPTVFLTLGVGEVEEVGVSVTARRGAVEVSCAEADAAVQVYDMAGRLIATARTKADSPLLLPVPAAGVYTVRVGSGPAHKVVVL